MTEIPEHLLESEPSGEAQGGRERGGRRTGAGAPRPRPAPAPARRRRCQGESRIPAHLLERSKAAKARASGEAEDTGGGGTAGATATAATAAVARRPQRAVCPVGAGPGGHTQRLLTVVKSGSIQEVKATPVDKVHTWPHLLLPSSSWRRSLCTAFLFVFSVFVQRPAARLANINQTPNPSKAPWYFLGSAGAAHHVPPDGGRRDHPRYRVSSR